MKLEGQFSLNGPLCIYNFIGKCNSKYWIFIIVKIDFKIAILQIIREIIFLRRDLLLVIITKIII